MPVPIAKHAVHGDVYCGRSGGFNLKALPLTNYVKASALAYPPVCAWERSIPWGMLGNGPDTYKGRPFSGAGDCVIAWMLHHIMAMQSVANAGSPITFTADQAIDTYSTITGYVVGDENTDNGTDPDVAANYWRDNGLFGHKIDGYVNLDISNVDLLRYAIWMFGGIGFSFDVPEYIMEVPNGQSWSYKGGNISMVGGHQIYLPGYGRQGFHLISWGTDYLFNLDFLGRFGRAAQAVISKDWIKASGISPTGLDLAGLTQDLAAL